MRTYFWVAIVLFSLSFSVFADSLLQNLPGNLISAREGGYVGQRSRVVSAWDVRFYNLGEDSTNTGDYFRGYYYDPAYGFFSLDAVNSDKVRVTSVSASCSNSSTHVGYKLQGFWYSPLFGFMNFNFNNSIFTYICYPRNFDDDSYSTYIGGYAFSPLLGFQNFDGWNFDSSIDICDPLVDINCENDEYAQGRYIKVEWNVATHNSEEALTGQFNDEVRIIGKLEKSSFRKDIHEGVYSVIKNISSAPEPSSINLNQATWDSGTRLKDNTVLFIKNPSGLVELSSSSIRGVKTIVVENGSIFIRGNLMNQSSGNNLLWIIALSGDASESGNIYIDSTVTDIHAVIYADKSILSRNAANTLYTSWEPQDALKNQLYIYGSIFSENTIGGSFMSPYTCPYFIDTGNCTTKAQAEKYDLNTLRRYSLVTEVDSDGTPTGNLIPAYGGQQATGNSSNVNWITQYDKYPLVIEYNPGISQYTLPFFN